MVVRRDPHAPDVQPSPAVRREVDLFAGMRPHRIEILEPAVGESRNCPRGKVDNFYAEFRTFDILEDDVLPVGRPAWFHMIHGFGTLRSDLLGVMSMCIDDPNTSRASPRSIHGDRLPVR